MCSLPVALALDAAETGRQLGHDFYRCSRLHPANEWPPSVTEGFLHAQAQHTARQVPDRFQRKWLQLRLGAYQRGRYVDAQVTPALLSDIDVATCPVLRIPLTHGERLGSDWSVDRLNNDGAYARSNLAVMCRTANAAKGQKTFADVYALSGLPDGDAALEALTPAQWLRLASLMLGPCFATRPQDAPLLPLVTPVPLHTVRQIGQCVQYVFTQLAGRQSGKNALIKAFSPATEHTHLLRLRRLAEAVHQGLKHTPLCWDVWLQPGLMPLLRDWRSTLSNAQWGHCGEVSRQLAGACKVNPQRLQPWHLASRGYQSARWR